MDAFKFAFETTIVGLLSLPWLALLIAMFYQPLQLFNRIQRGSTVLESATFGVLTLAIAYSMGSAISPLAAQLLDDQDLPIPYKSRKIKADLYLKTLDLLKLNTLLNTSDTPISRAAAKILDCSPSPACSKSKEFWEASDNLFTLQEEVVLGDGTDKTERIVRLHEQVVVLRGAVFNVGVFVVLCWFAYFSRLRSETMHVVLSNPIAVLKTVVAISLTIFLIFVAANYGELDVRRHDVTDPPIMELGLLILGGLGISAELIGVVKRPPAVALVVGLILIPVVYGAWAWTEVLYSRSLISAFLAWH